MQLPSGEGDAEEVDETAYQLHSFFRFFFAEWVREPSRQRLVTTTTGLPEASYLVLRRLQDTGPASVTQLARASGLDPSTVNRQVRPLRDAGLVEPRRGVVGRTTDLRVTDAGRAVLARTDLAQVRDWERVVAALPPGRRPETAALLADLRAAMEAATASRRAGASVGSERRPPPAVGPERGAGA